MDASHMGASHMGASHMGAGHMNTMMGAMGAMGAHHMSPRQVPFGGFPGAGVGGNLDLDVGGGFGGGFPGLLGGGFPGWGSPYIPITPLGALGGMKGDLLVPIVAIGVALFLLVIIVLAVKMALAWKLSVLSDLTNGPKKWRRDIGSGAAPQLDNDYMIQLAKVVTSAIYSGSCSDRIICEVGAFARGNADQLEGIVKLVESFIPESYHSALDILRTSAKAKGDFNCGQEYQCGAGTSSSDKLEQAQGQPGSNSTIAASSASPTNPPQQQQQQKQQQQQQQQPPKPRGLFGITPNEMKQDHQAMPNKFRRNI